MMAREGKPPGEPTQQELRTVGLSERKAEYIRNVASMIAEEKLNLETLKTSKNPTMPALMLTAGIAIVKNCVDTCATSKVPSFRGTLYGYFNGLTRCSS